MDYEVIRQHRSNYPNPITLARDQVVILGERYDGPENWDNWVFCRTLDGGRSGWVPEQLIDTGAAASAEEGTGPGAAVDAGDGAGPSRGRMLADYTARELNVDPGDRVAGLRELNGWVWCERVGGAKAGSKAVAEAGWIPKDNLKPLP